MYETTTDTAERKRMDGDTLSVTLEAVNLEGMTLTWMGFDPENLETEPLSSGPPDNESEEESDTHGLDISAVQMQKAAWAVVNEARRLQGEVEKMECYVAQHVMNAAEDSDDSPSSTEETDVRYDMAQEATAIVKEAERLQKLVLYLSTRMAETVEDDDD